MLLQIMGQNARQKEILVTTIELFGSNRNMDLHDKLTVLVSDRQCMF